MGKKRLASKISQEIRTEMRISNFNLKWGLVRKIYAWGILYTLRGCVPHYTPSHLHKKKSQGIRSGDRGGHSITWFKAIT